MIDQQILPQHIEDITELGKGMLAKGYSEDDVKLLYKACEFAAQAHKGQKRKSGEPYITHPIGVASLLVALGLDIDSLLTALLHDTVEDTAVTLESIEEAFGSTVCHLVDGVTKLTQIKFRHIHAKQSENIRKMIVAMGQDLRVILVKLADRLHNMRTLSHMPADKQARIALETLGVYAPLAGRLGIHSIKIELEDLSFRYSEPERFYQLVQKIDKTRKDREEYITKTKIALGDAINKRTDVSFEVQGRPKHLYSIFKKIERRNIDYEHVYDILGFRICVNTIAECYEVLGIVHSLWKPIPGRFKDFIAMAKANNYQSLHTAVIGPGAERIEIQIRTFEMHRVAELGVAAHWKYKQDTYNAEVTDGPGVNRFQWLQELMQQHQQIKDSDEFLENIKTDLVESEIYVFTPKGEIKEFPEGATTIDFAYAVHTDVGSRVIASRVNGKMVPLKYKLQNGDSVDVITSNNQTPSKDWLNICVTARAQSRIRGFVKKEQRQQAVVLGRELMEKMMRKYKMTLLRLMNHENLSKYLKDQGCSSFEDLLVRVGYGKLLPMSVLYAVFPAKDPKNKSNALNLAGKMLTRFKSKKKSKGSLSIVNVDGFSDMLVRFGRCCSPIPGEPIIGFITRGRGITIHRVDCAKIFSLDADRRIDVEWSKTKSEESRIVRMRILSHDIPGLLINITETFSMLGVNIHNAQIQTTRDTKAICVFDVSVRDTKHLSDIINGLQKIKGVIVVTRISYS